MGMNIEKILKEMSLEEKIALGSGKDYWHTKEMESHDLPSLMMADGPHGLRKQEEGADMLGINKSIQATCFPTAVSAACSWNRELLQMEGKAIGKEALANGVGVVLGPGANIKRSPLCGRNFEYFSEDPYLTGELAAAHIQGAQEAGCGTSLKHFAFNNQEYKRFSSDSIMDERAMREIYLAGFEKAVKNGKPDTVMCAYNKINGEHCSESKMLLTDVLRNEWGFDGMVVSDWGAMYNRMKSFEAGCDLCMPGGSAFMEKEAISAVKNGELDEKHIDITARRILKLVDKGMESVSKAEPVNMEAHYELARKIAGESAVLLKNNENVLPLSQKESVVFIGHMAEEVRYQGAGSSHINPWKLTSVMDVCPNIPYVKGCLADGTTSESLLDEVKKAAKQASKVVVFAGLTTSYESEGFDRDTLAMPEGHNKMIEAAANANENVVVVLMCGSVVELPWYDKVKAILYMGLSGEASGDAISDLLFGKISPSGKLAETWPLKKEDCICDSYYGRKNAEYRESVYVGYRYYNSANVAVRFPFGYGLSYTEFEYSNLKVENDVVTCTVKNVGQVVGKEIAQLYIGAKDSEIYRPEFELKGFEKVELEPGESKEIHFALTERSFAIWDGNWKVPSGTYSIAVGRNSREMCLQTDIVKMGIGAECFSERLRQAPMWYSNLQGVPEKSDLETLIGRKIEEAPLKKGNFTMENTVMEMKDYSFIMKLMYKVAELYVASGFGWKRDYSNPEFRMMLCSVADASLSGIKINSGMNNHIMEGLLEMANGQVGS